MLLSITVIIKKPLPDLNTRAEAPTVITLEVDEKHIDAFLDILDPQDFERLNRLMTDVHNLRQENLLLTRENGYLKNNLGAITNSYMNNHDKEVEFNLIETDDSLELSDVDLKELEHKSNGFSHG